MDSSYFLANSSVQSVMVEPVPHDVMINELEKIYQDNVHKSIPGTFASAMRGMFEIANHSEAATKEFSKFCSIKESDKKLQLKNVDIPEGILLGGLKGVICDVKIHSKGGPDDTVYKNNPDIRSKVPRGVTILKISGDVTLNDVVIYGFKKFTGGIGDEDDNQPDNNDMWREYCISNPDYTRNVVCMSKENGEAAHFSGRYIGGHFYITVGSKNVHMVIRERSHIDLYEGPRYAFAKVIAETVFDELNQLDSRKRQLFYSFLHHTKCTIVCEILQPQNQHIVNLSHLNKPKLVVITFTPTVSEVTSNSMTTFHPGTVLDLAKALGFESAKYEIIPYSDILLRREMIRNAFNTEGEVLYLINDDGNTIGLIKVKAAWYILLRALREKAVYCFTSAMKKQGKEWRLSYYVNSAHKRLKQIRSWLRFTANYLKAWEKLSEAFLQWLNLEINKGNVDPQAIRPCFPCIWNNFLQDTKSNDKIPFAKDAPSPS